MKRQKTNTGLFRQVALIVCLFAGLFSGWSAAAQQSGVHGQVTDRKTGQPVVGATVRVEGTTIATSTDILGQYRIAALPDKCTLIFSYVGYESRTVEYHAQQTAVDVALAEDVQNLDEVVEEDGLNGLNVNDVESVQILKDAASTAIYGAAGANGVIIVTTKRGRNQRAEVSLETKFGISEVARYYEMMNSEQCMDMMDEAGVKPEDIHGIEDLYKLPFITKDDLRDQYPYGLLGVPLSDCVRIQSTSGTTGRRVVAFYTQEDLDIWEECCARAIVAAGGTKDDVCHVCYGYGLFTGGPGLNGGSHKVGCLTLPMSSGNTERQLQFMTDLGSTIICCTPSYAANLAEAINERTPPRTAPASHPPSGSQGIPPGHWRHTVRSAA